MLLLYLTVFVFGFFFVLDQLMRRKIKKGKTHALELQHKTDLPPISDMIQNCPLVTPQGYFISKRHIWIHLLSSQEVRIGLDGLCPKLVSKIDSISLHNSGDKVNENGSMCAIYQGNKKLKFYSPIDGIVQEVNAELQENPEIICSDPYEKGWIYRIKPALQFSGLDINQQLSMDVLKWREFEMTRLVNFFLEERKTRRQLEENIRKGKLILEGLLDYLDSFGWAKFEKSFLV